ncbi:hypothetical protein [Burkholderia stagnalis]|uniref:hypothetical protein n=1 Tax=Burkholderia stagnalis TaxID=1503054 RepID=UPI000A557683|nr:hypothetical protein [Burkholderia stagnalis]
MPIRQDFVSVSQPLHRLLGYSRAFDEFSRDWSHYKHEEDFMTIAQFNWQIRGPFDDLYAEGRQFASGLAEKLNSFNDIGRYPTLKSYVDSFSFGDESPFSKRKLIEVAGKAKKVAALLGKDTPWSIGQMIPLMDRQIRFIEDVEATLDRLRKSNLYLEESGIFLHETDLNEQILSSIHHSGRTFERLPSTRRGKDEESLRDLILVGLNGTLRSYVPGEAVNGKGKTDILVNIAGVNEFIGECKFWGGEVAYLSTIDQLFGYLTGRDKNAAVVLFVKNKNFSDVLEKIEEYTPKHSNFLRLVEKRDRGWLIYQFKILDDLGQSVQLAIMAYHLPD